MATATESFMVNTGPLSGMSNTVVDVPDHNADRDHPEGDGIRRQVEYYFSDENLPTDIHMLQCCGGRDNIPVSISRICGFKKMRSYKPRSLVTAALRKSVLLEVSTDGKTIKRKIPLQGKCVLDSDFFDDEEIAYDPRTYKSVVHPVPLLSQKKAGNPQGLSKNMLKPTGFEKTFVEAPQTSQEAAEEEAMYDADKPFVERIEIAIQRFKQKRRMHEMYAHVFDKLMRFGGIESSPRMCQGLSKQEMAEMDAEELARALAVHTVPWDRSDEKQWVVDFAGVGKAFLSSWYPTHYGYAPIAIKNVCQVLRSFYNYLLYHKVCPEYDVQLDVARKFCDTAEKELPKVKAAGLALPGDFNKAASTIFGGAQAGLYVSDKAWAEELKKEGINFEDIGIRVEEARIKFATGVAIMGSDEQYERVGTNKFRVACNEFAGLQVTAIRVPDKLTKASYAQQSEALQHKLGRLEPLGKLICRSQYTEDCDEWDLPKDKGRFPNGKPDQPHQAKEYEFWVEEKVLAECFVGMRLHARVLTLEGGLTILDEAIETMCSFFTWIPNELWMRRKPKEVRWLRNGMGLDGEEAEINGENMEHKNKGASDEEFDDD
ncbi:Argonaute siRNA chaperone complex subunit Arb1-domain-containing protein [Pyrenochaeta sp. MPI-SDFR-AT-0127]|nr:Argonaute siRNA chaperone complex subunit Arb1-domain-containing protein [Pyrenochaeta sp. MPI-SDFR-AT-0127]